LKKYGNSKSVVLKVVDIDPQGSIGPSKGLINSHGVEWASLNGQGVMKTAVVYWSNEAPNSKLLLIRQGMETAFFNRSNKIKRSYQISPTVVSKYIRFE